MKSTILIFFFLAIFVILSSSCSISAARPLPLPQAEEEKLLLKAHGVMDTQLEDITTLMGAEETEGQECDDECVKRRMIAEAHLDYIYTQNHNP